MINSASHNMYRHRIVAKESFLKQFLKRPETIPLIFFATSLALWLAFLSKVYFENSSEAEATSTINTYSNSKMLQPSKTKVVSNSNDRLTGQNENHDIVDTNILKINELTEQLMIEQQKTQELTQLVAQQKIELGGMIKDAITKVSPNDRSYLSGLDQLDNEKSSFEETDRTVLANTDYYNRVVISPSQANSNPLQNQINAFYKRTPN